RLGGVSGEGGDVGAHGLGIDALGERRSRGRRANAVQRRVEPLEESPDVVAFAAALVALRRIAEHELVGFLDFLDPVREVAGVCAHLSSPAEICQETPASVSWPWTSRV